MTFFAFRLDSCWREPPRPHRRNTRAEEFDQGGDGVLDNGDKQVGRMDLWDSAGRRVL